MEEADSLGTGLIENSERPYTELIVEMMQEYRDLFNDLQRRIKRLREQSIIAEKIVKEVSRHNMNCCKFCSVLFIP